MHKLPHDASALTQEMRHRELLGLGPLIERVDYVDVAAKLDGIA